MQPDRFGLDLLPSTRSLRLGSDFVLCEVHYDLYATMEHILVSKNDS